jgi:hypothetical protein
MRKKMFVVLIAILLLPLAGCLDDDDYSLDKYWVTTATIEKTGTDSYLIVTDNGDRLYPSATAIPYFSIEDNQRVWVDYTILGDATGDVTYYVKVNNMSEILTKGILSLTPQNTDSIGNDEVKIANYWISGDYLTIRFLYGGGQHIHFINLVQDVNNPVDGDGLPVLLFRHNRNDDPANYRMYGTVSISLESLRLDNQAYAPFVLKCDGFNGEPAFEELLVYVYAGDE